MLEKMLTVSVKNKVQPIHWHDLLELNLVLVGEMEVVRNNRVFSLQEGEMIVLNRDDVHSISSKSEEFLYIQIQFSMEYYNQYIPDIWTVLFDCSPKNDDIISQNLKAEMKSHLCSIVRMMDAHRDYVDAEKKIVYYCIDILSTLKMAFAAVRSSEASSLSEEQNGRLWKAIDYMYDNHARKLTLHEVAQQVYISADYLSKLLKKQSGMAFEEFLSFIRAEMSIRALLNTDMSITNIAYECGFSAPKYYHAAFLKIYGCAPLEYRKNNRKNFMMERQKEAAKVLYDDGIDKRHVFKLMEKYRILSEIPSSVQETIRIDIRNFKNGAVGFGAVKYPKTNTKDFLGYMVDAALAEIQTPCFKLCDHVYAWQEHDAIKLLAAGLENSGRSEYVIQIEGLENPGHYIYCREKTPDIPDGIKKMIEKGEMHKLDRDLAGNLYHRTFEYGEVLHKQQLSMNIGLEKGQIAKITLQKIK